MNENEKNQKISNRSIANAAENRYLCFNLAGDYYAIPLLQVKEVIGIPEFTPIPYVASHFCGIMNLRGQVISVIDLRKKLNVPANKGDENSVLVCLLDNIVMGALVDSVDFVINLDKKNIMLKTNIQTTIRMDFIEGFYEHNNHLIIILNLAKTLSIEDLIHLDNNQVEKSSN